MGDSARTSSQSLPHALPTCPTLGSVSMSAGAAPPFDEPSDTSWPRDPLKIGAVPHTPEKVGQVWGD
jgi:hypothetical protein